MSRGILLDTSFLIAQAAEDDQHHEIARLSWKGLAAAPPTLVATDYILCEVVASFQNRHDHEKAVTLGEFLRDSPEITFILVDRDLLEESWKFLVDRPDKEYSLTDCVSFVLMRHLGISTALTFDRHFVQDGFQTRS